MMIFLGAILIVAAIWFIKYAKDNNIFSIYSSNNRNRAFEMLKKRYAHGDINKEQYENEKRHLP